MDSITVYPNTNTRTPLISVIVAVYNVEKYVTSCVESILNQTYHNIELIVVDDGSTDASSSKCDRYAQRDSRVRVLRKPNGGLSDARNYGLDCATGQYAVFVDGDDVVAPTFVETLYSELEQTDADVSSVAMLPTSNQEGYLNRCEQSISSFDAVVLDNSEILFDTLLSVHSTVSACAKLASIEFWKRKRFPVGKVYEDLATIPFLLAAANKMVASNKALYGFVYRRGSITRSKLISESQYTNYYSVIESLTELQGESQYVNEAISIKRLNEFARVKRLHSSLSEHTSETERVYRKLCNELRMNALKVLINPIVPMSMKLTIVLSTYTPKLYSILFRLYQNIKIDRIITH